ncbi:MAG: hypothetical protein LBE35_11385 [Clostridiales bacterium]|jgi:hypothetical protein|nr:hypothetical protein [Clostridiales bacterium]
MRLWEYGNKRIRITDKKGWFKEGIADLYTSAFDNPEEIASICVGDTIFFENEIASIEVLERAARPELVFAHD